MTVARAMGEEFDPDFEGEAMCGAKRFQPMTNGDKIRAMSDKELAGFLAGKFTDQTTQRMVEMGEMRSATSISYEADLWFRTWMQWLRMPAEVE